MKAVTPIPLTITSEAVVAALQTLGARKIVLDDAVRSSDERSRSRVSRAQRHHRAAEKGLGIDGGVEMAAVEPEQWYRETLALRDPDADAYFVSCTTIRSADVIEALEDALGQAGAHQQSSDAVAGAARRRHRRPDRRLRPPAEGLLSAGEVRPGLKTSRQSEGATRHD